MKYIVICMILFGLLVGLCCMSSCFVRTEIAETSMLLEAAVQMQQNQKEDAAVHLLQTAASQWRSNEVLLGTVLKHEEVDQVTSEFARLESYAKTEDQDDFLSGCEALIAQLQHIREMELPLLQNIM